MEKEERLHEYEYCELCPRKCRVNRYEEKGYCGMGAQLKCAKAMLHYWEESAITYGDAPSGAVFFSGCNLKCAYCQNFEVSRNGFGKEITTDRLAGIFRELEEKKASNIDLVTPTHFVPSIIKAFEKRRPQVPVVYNCGGYENPETIKLISPYVAYWLPDIKYFSDDLAVKYSKAPDYFETACRMLETMLEYVRRCGSDAEPCGPDVQSCSPGGAVTGCGSEKESKGRIIVRHMVLPGCKDDSIKLLRALYERYGSDSFLLSLMSQYTPFGKAADYPEINRRVTTYEYEKVLDEAVRLGFDGFMQERTSAKEEYTPEFDLAGL